MYTAIIMAGGKGTRFRGGYKLLAPIDGKPMVRIVAEKALRIFPEVILVTGYRADLILDAVEGLPLDICHNTAWAAGQSESLKCGLRALPKGTEGICPMPADQAFVMDTTLDRLVQTASARPDSIIVPTFRGQRGTPTIFPASCLSELFSVLDGDQGGRALLKIRGFYPMETDDPGILSDIDTVEDYEKYRKAPVTNQGRNLNEE